MWTVTIRMNKSNEASHNVKQNKCQRYDNNNNAGLNIQEWFLSRNDRQNSRGGGVALVVRKSVKHESQRNRNACVINFILSNTPMSIPFNLLDYEILSDVKCLRICLDKKLNFAKHICEVCKKFLKVIRALWLIICYRSGLNIKNKNLITLILTYACPI